MASPEYDADALLDRFVEAGKTKDIDPPEYDADALLDRYVDTGSAAADFDEFQQMTESQRLAEQVGQPDLAPGGMTETGARFDIGSADTRTEKLRVFKQHFPEGDLVFANSFVAGARDPKVTARMQGGGPGTEEPVLLFRPDPSQPFKRVDAEFLNTTNMTSEVVGDVVDFFSDDLFSIATEVAATLPAGRWLKLIPMWVRQTLGAAGGEVIEEGVQKARGISDEDLMDVSERAGGQAIASMAGQVVGSKVVRPGVNAIRGAGMFGRTTGASQAQRASLRLLDKPLPLNLVTDSPLVKKLGGQAGALTTTLSRYVDRLETSLAVVARSEAAKALKAAGGPQQGIKVAGEALAREKQRLYNMVTKRTSRKKRDIKAMSDDLEQGIAEWDYKALGFINDAYGRARSIEEPEFDIDPLMDAVKKVELRGVAPDAEGKAIPTGALPTELKGIIDTIKQLDPELKPLVLEDGSQVLPTEYLRGIREQLFGLKTPNPGEIKRREHFLAGDLYKAITDVIRNPKNQNKQFVDAWKGADRLAAERFTTWENTVLIQAARGDNISLLSQSLTNLGDAANIERIDVLRRVLPPNKWEGVKDGIWTEMTRDPFKISQKMKNARPEVIAKVFSPQERAGLQALGQGFDRLSMIGLQKIRDGQAKLGTAVGRLVDRDDTAGVKEALDVVKRQGGRDSPLGRFFRAGAMQDIIQSATVFEKGARRIDANKLKARIGKYQESGALAFLTKDDIRLLRDTRAVQDILRQRSDAGTSLQAAEAVAQTRGALTGDLAAAASGIATIVENIGVSRAMINPKVINALVGSGTRQRIERSNAIQLSSAAVTQLATDAEAVMAGTNNIVDMVMDLLPGGGTE